MNETFKNSDYKSDDSTAASAPHAYSPLWLDFPYICIECKEEAVGVIGADGSTHKSIWSENPGNIHIWERKMLEDVHVATCELTERRCSLGNDTRLNLLVFCHHS